MLHDSLCCYSIWSHKFSCIRQQLEIWKIVKEIPIHDLKKTKPSEETEVLHCIFFFPQSKYLQINH